jgi:hypothetical protein
MALKTFQGDHHRLHLLDTLVMVHPVRRLHHSLCLPSLLVRPSVLPLAVLLLEVRLELLVLE